MTDDDASAVLETLLKYGATFGYTMRKTESGVQLLRPDGTMVFAATAKDPEQLARMWAMQDRVWSPGATS